MNASPKTALVLACLFMVLPNEHHHTVEPEPGSYVTPPIVAANVTAQAVTSSTYYSSLTA
jgi:hypothetical protein